MKLCRLLLVTLVATLFAGCASRIVNLTARSATSTSADVYRFEVQWDTSRRWANNSDVRAYVMIDDSLFPMERIVGTTNRWESNVPVPAGRTVVSYRYKVDYHYPTFSGPAFESALSPPYSLDLRRTPPAGR